ncbi:MFS transporter [Actinoallomurus sp. CA-150999]|uniref:MFS transporter n=1 Tax=Actinoallomurus sp. CA-150999 TaxID=3239887 RepID=UPI003D903FE0
MFDHAVAGRVPWDGLTHRSSGRSGVKRPSFQLAEATLILSGVAKVWSLAAVSGGGAAGAALFTPVGRRLLAQLLSGAALARANALTQATKHGIATLGPVAGGALIVTIGAGWGILWDCLTYIAAAVLFTRLPTVRTSGKQNPGQIRQRTSRGAQRRHPCDHQQDLAVDHDARRLCDRWRVRRRHADRPAVRARASARRPQLGNDRRYARRRDLDRQHPRRPMAKPPTGILDEPRHRVYSGRIRRSTSITGRHRRSCERPGQPTATNLEALQACSTAWPRRTSASKGSSGSPRSRPCCGSGAPTT